MKIQLTTEHIQKAIEDKNKTGAVCCTCPVFQALQSAGIPVGSVGIKHWRTVSELEVTRPLPLGARKITALLSKSWPTIPPCEFEIDWP